MQTMSCVAGTGQHSPANKLVEIFKSSPHSAQQETHTSPITQPHHQPSQDANSFIKCHSETILWIFKIAKILLKLMCASVGGDKLSMKLHNLF